jgi:LPS-assembly lipoprotein
MLLFKKLLLLPLILLSGCFTPLYGVNSSGKASHQQLLQVDIAPIGGRVGTGLRNDLIFYFSGNGQMPEKPKYRLHVAVAFTSSLLVVDTQAYRPQNESYTMNAEYRLVEISSLKEVFKGVAFSTASIDVGQQRFARDRARLDAQDRTARVVADQISSHVAGYFQSQDK